MEPYRVPFVFDRSRAPVFRLVNVGTEPLRVVSVNLTGAGVMPAPGPMTLRPHEALEITVHGHDLSVATALIIRWLRPSDEDYLLRVTF